MILIEGPEQYSPMHLPFESPRCLWGLFEAGGRSLTRLIPLRFSLLVCCYHLSVSRLIVGREGITQGNEQIRCRAVLA